MGRIDEPGDVATGPQDAGLLSEASDRKVWGLESFFILVFPPHLRIQNLLDRTSSRHAQSRM